MKRVRADWSEVVLVCRKCSKKLKGGFGEDGDQPLARALRREFASGDTSAKAGKSGKSGKPKRRGTKVAVLEVGCFDVCPKGAVVVVSASTPGEWLVVPRGTATSTVRQRLSPDSGEA